MFLELWWVQVLLKSTVLTHSNAFIIFSCGTAAYCDGYCMFQYLNWFPIYYGHTLALFQWQFNWVNLTQTTFHIQGSIRGPLIYLRICNPRVFICCMAKKLIQKLVTNSIDFTIMLMSYIWRSSMALQLAVFFNSSHLLIFIDF